MVWGKTKEGSDPLAKDHKDDEEEKPSSIDLQDTLNVVKIEVKDEPTANDHEDSILIIKHEEWEAASAMDHRNFINPEKIYVVDGPSMKEGDAQPAKDNQDLIRQVKIEEEEASDAQAQALITVSGEYEKRFATDIQEFLEAANSRSATVMRPKPKRKAPFNLQELKILTDELLRYKYLLFGNHGERASAPTRKLIWRAILDKINAVASEVRDVEDIHRRWQDLKLILRRDDTAWNRSMVATGGGRPSLEHLPPYKRTALQILDIITLEGAGTADHGAGGSTDPLGAGPTTPGLQRYSPAAQWGRLHRQHAAPTSSACSQDDPTIAEGRGPRPASPPRRAKPHRHQASPAGSQDISSDAGGQRSASPHRWPREHRHRSTPPPLSTFQAVVSAAMQKRPLPPPSRTPSPLPPHSPPPIHPAQAKLPLQPPASGLSPLVTAKTAGKRKRTPPPLLGTKPATAVVPVDQKPSSGRG